ncbi:zinc finger protein 557-like [Euwallacea similis]|uniref:zinc finger protein 557-like n=1 Tax=Euwallacea similis TaxID=1736056 RepID=UPI00344BC695
MNKTTNFCCICLKETSDFESATEQDSDGVKYSEKLALCDPTQEWEDNNLSLCNTCLINLDVVYKFIHLCRKSYKLRRGNLQLQESEPQKNQLDNESFTCFTCKKVFKKKRFLKSHITRTHLASDDRKKDTDSDPPIDSKVLPKEEDINLHEHSNLTIKNEGSLKEEAEEVGHYSDYFPNEDTYSSDEDEKPKLRKSRAKKSKKPDSYTCEYCGKQFNRHQHWSAHIRSKHTFEKPYKCKLCEASFTTSHSLLVHKRNHNNEKPYICSTCGKGFVCSGDLFHHNKIHLNKKEYECNVCQKRFNTTSILRTHKIVKHTQPQDWKYICVLCERRFPINSSLALHMKRHTGVKDHPCHICGKKFFNKSEVTKHILSHSNQKNFKCHLCEDKEYKNKEGLNKHLKIIHDLGTWKAPKLEKRFLCVLCPRRFTFNNKLQRHLLTHTGEKPYKCDYCEKKFSDTYYRKNHMKKEHSEHLDEDGNIKYLESVVSNNFT